MAIVPSMLAANANAWTIDQSYDSQALGETCENWGSSQSYVTDLKSYSGGKSCLQHIKAGQTAFGIWGGIINHPSNLKRGDEIWIRVRTFFPAGFNYDSTSEGNRLKFLRVHTMDASNPNYGYDDLYINPSSNSVPFQFIYEGEQKWTTVGTSADKIQRGTWETYEFYVKFDSVPVDSGGQARVRIWKNGTLLRDITDRQTLKNTVAYADRTHIFTYWNGGSPLTQQMYIDDLVVTSDVPSNVDAFGNRFVGVGVSVAAPNPPNNVR